MNIYNGEHLRWWASILDCFSLIWRSDSKYGVTLFPILITLTAVPTCVHALNIVPNKIHSCSVSPSSLPRCFPCQRRRPHVPRNRSLARHLPRLIFFLLLRLRVSSSSSSSWCHVCTPKSHERPVGPGGASRQGSRWDPLPGRTRLSGSCNSLANFLDGDLAIWHALNKIESKHTCHMWFDHRLRIIVDARFMQYLWNILVIFLRCNMWSVMLSGSTEC